MPSPKPSNLPNMEARAGERVECFPPRIMHRQGHHALAEVRALSTTIIQLGKRCPVRATLVQIGQMVRKTLPSVSRLESPGGTSERAAIAAVVIATHTPTAAMAAAVTATETARVIARSSCGRASMRMHERDPAETKRLLRCQTRGADRLAAVRRPLGGDRHSVGVLWVSHVPSNARCSGKDCRLK